MPVDRPPDRALPRGPDPVPVSPSGGPVGRAPDRAPGVAARRPPLLRRARTGPGEPVPAPDGVLLSVRHDPPSAGATDPDLCFVVAQGFTGSWRRPDVARIAVLLRATAGVVSFAVRGHAEAAASPDLIARIAARARPASTGDGPSSARMPA